MVASAHDLSLVTSTCGIVFVGVPCLETFEGVRDTPGSKRGGLGRGVARLIEEALLEID